MINLYIDFDGVILDTIRVTYRIAKEMNIEFKKEADYRKFYETLDWKNILSITPVINDAFTCIEEILNSNRFDVAILTHVNSLNEIIEKVKFIRHYLGNVTIIPVPKALSKTKMVHAKDAILVDDYRSNLKEWKEAGGISIRFDVEKKGKGYPVIDRLDQLLTMDFQMNEK